MPLPPLDVLLPLFSAGGFAFALAFRFSFACCSWAASELMSIAPAFISPPGGSGGGGGAFVGIAGAGGAAADVGWMTPFGAVLGKALLNAGGGGGATGICG